MNCTGIPLKCVISAKKGKTILIKGMLDKKGKKLYGKKE